MPSDLCSIRLDRQRAVTGRLESGKSKLISGQLDGGGRMWLYSHVVVRVERRVAPQRLAAACCAVGTPRRMSTVDSVRCASRTDRQLLLLDYGYVHPGVENATGEVCCPLSAVRCPSAALHWALRYHRHAVIHLVD